MFVRDEGITVRGLAEALQVKPAPAEVEVRLTLTVSCEHHFPDACEGVKITSGSVFTVTLNVPGEPAVQRVAGSVYITLIWLVPGIVQVTFAKSFPAWPPEVINPPCRCRPDVIEFAGLGCVKIPCITGTNRRDT